MKFRIKDRETGKYWATCGWTTFVHRAYKWDTREEAEAELTWIMQHELQNQPIGLVLQIVETES